MNKSMLKYSVPTLIELVECRPCLWDRTDISFKNKVEKQDAWFEVFCFLVEGFAERDVSEQRHIGDVINVKWNNIRDSFVKSLKKRHSATGPTKKYVYHDNLRFLMKVLQRDYDTKSNTDSDNEHKTNLCNSNAYSEQVVTIPKPVVENVIKNEYASTSKEQLQNRPTITPTKRRRLNDDIDREILEVLRKPPDQDEAFFTSIIPSIRTFSEGEKLDFRMNVLQLIKDTRNNRRHAMTIIPEYE